ncbi:MAG: methionyl-tRNA formyltransferase [Acidimicrobiales bacterium]|nr:methionyl-tRNA formyltransferase [Acidimicrobiales bacterium]
MGPFVYLGTPEEAVPPLQALHAAGHEIVLVVTRADARRRRHRPPEPSPVKVAAQELGLPVSHSLDDVLTCGARRGIVVAFGLIVPSHMLEAVPMVNLHFSRLPRWRGAAPVERAILAGDTETAVAVMEMEAGLDTGPIHAERPVTIDPRDTAESLRERLVAVGTELLIETIEGEMRTEPIRQEGEVIYAQKITADDRRIDWSATARAIDAQVRIGRAHTTFRGDRFLIWASEVLPIEVGEPGLLVKRDSKLLVGAGSGALELVEVQPASRPRMSAQAWWNGAQPEGSRLGS